MTKERFVTTVQHLQYTKLHPADRRVMNEFLRVKREEIVAKYFELAERIREPEAKDEKP